MKLGYVAFWVAFSLLLFGCDQKPNTGVRICVDAKTHERVSTSQCAHDSNNPSEFFMWYWILSNNTNYNVPAIGRSIEGYSYRAWSSQDDALPSSTRIDNTVTDNLAGEVTTDSPATTGGDLTVSSEPAASDNSEATSGGSGEAPESSAPSEESSGSSAPAESESSGGGGGSSGGEE